MRSLFSFTVEHFLLFEATLLQYAYFTSAQSSSIGNLSTCAGCAITASQTILSYPGSVNLKTTSQSVTLIPYITVYDNGNITNWSTYTKYDSKASTGGLATSPPDLTWTTFGATLTYPTTYVAFEEVSAGVSSIIDGTCAPQVTSAELQPSQQASLIFASSSGAAASDLSSSAVNVIRSLPTVSALVSPYAPARCSVLAPGQQIPKIVSGIPPALSTESAATSLANTPPAPVVHTSVRYLTTEGQAVITVKTGTAPPAQQQSNPGTNGGSGGGNNGGSSGNGGQSGNNNQGPTITFGGSTYTAGPGGSWNFGNGALTAGGSAQVIGGTTISVAGSGVVVINGKTTTASAATSTKPAQATGGAESQFQGSTITLVIGGVIGLFGMLVGIVL